MVEAPDMQLLVHAGDLAEILARACGVATVDLASAAEIIPPVGVQAGSAERLSIEKGLVGNSRMCVSPAAMSAEFLSPAVFTGLRKTSKTLPSLVTTATAFLSLASTQILPARSKAMPSAPSRMG